MKNHLLLLAVIYLSGSLRSPLLEAVDLSKCLDALTKAALITLESRSQMQAPDLEEKQARAEEWLWSRIHEMTHLPGLPGGPSKKLELTKGLFTWKFGKETWSAVVVYLYDIYSPPKLKRPEAGQDRVLNMGSHLITTLHHIRIFAETASEAGEFPDELDERMKQIESFKTALVLQNFDVSDIAREPVEPPSFATIETLQNQLLQSSGITKNLIDTLRQKGILVTAELIEDSQRRWEEHLQLMRDSRNQAEQRVHEESERRKRHQEQYDDLVRTYGATRVDEAIETFNQRRYSEAGGNAVLAFNLNIHLAPILEILEDERD